MQNLQFQKTIPSTYIDQTAVMTTAIRSHSEQVKYRSNHPRLGAAAVLVMGAIAVFFLMAAISIDIAYMQLTKMEIRSAADAAAMAGTEALMREDSSAAAIAAAKSVAVANYIDGAGLVLSDSDIELGKAVRNENGSWSFQPGQKPFSSVRVNASHPVSLFMGGLTGRSDFEPTVVSTSAFSETEVCLVVDRSHSMCFDLTGVQWSYPPATPTSPDPVVFPPDPNDSRWSYLADAIDAFNQVVEGRSVQPRVGMVTFGSEIDESTYEYSLSGRTFPAVTVDSNLDSDLSKITAAIQVRSQDLMFGGTNLSSGMQAGVDMLTSADARDSASKSMILMTDGQWNAGINPVEVAKVAKSNDITIHCVSFLDNADQKDMRMVAKRTGGQFIHASSGPELIEAFRELAFRLPVSMVE